MTEVQQLVSNQGYQKLLAGAELPEEEERLLLDAVARLNPRGLPGLCQLFANHRRQARASQHAAEAAYHAARAELARLLEPPLYPSDVVRVRPDGRLEVVAGGRRQIVVAAPAVDCTALGPGCEVLLNRDQTAVMATGDTRGRAGVVVTVTQVDGDRVVLRGPGDEEIVGICSPALAAELQAGDRVVYARESRCVLDRLPERGDSAFVLTKPPATTFADIGGLDDVIAKIKRDLGRLRRPPTADRYRQRPNRGCVLVGAPGTGKTSVAAGIANYLRETDPDARFMHVAPGALRGCLYGQTEARIRELFASARRAPGTVVMFLDEIDSYGTRGTGIGQDIDGRVLGTLLDEIDGLESDGRIFCVGATNRLDLCDAAFVRPGRLGGRIYCIGRPNRAAARQIFERYLTADLPFEPIGDPDARGACIEAALAYLYAARGGAATLATVTLANGDRRDVSPVQVMSGALIENAVEIAKDSAAERDLDSSGAITIEDVLAALDEVLAAETEKIRTPPAARRILEEPGMDEIVRVELPVRVHQPRHRFLRAI